MMKKRQISITLDEETYKKLKRESCSIGLPLSRIIELKIKGYEIKKI